MRRLLVLILLLPLGVQAAMEQLFYCTDGDTGYDLYLSQNGQLRASNKSGNQEYLGTYTNFGDKVTLTIPGVLQESSMQVERGKGLYLAMQFPSLFCHAVGHAIGPSYDAYADCPDIKYIPSVSYEKNAFQFYKNHMVKRQRWRELLASADTLYSEIYGVYLVEGERVTMYFGDAKSEQLLSGTIIGGTGLSIAQLEPQKGACEIQ